MQIKICETNALGNEIRDLLKIAKDQTLRSADISSFKMNEYNISNNSKKINIYTLIPSLENSIIIEIFNDENENKIYMIKDNLFSEISAETLDKIKVKNAKVEILESSFEQEKILDFIGEIPEEIMAIQEVFDKVFIYNKSTTLNEIYADYCNAIHNMRVNQLMYLERYRKNITITRTLQNK